MENTTERPYSEVEGKPIYDQYLPGAVQVLIEWLLLIVSTLLSFFKNREE